MHYKPVCLCHSFTLTLQCRQEIYAIFEQEIQYGDNRSCHDRDADNRNGLFKKRILVRPCNLLKFSFQTFKKTRFRRLICLCGTSHALLLSTTAGQSYFVSLCIVCFLQNLQYFFVSILSGCFFLSFVVL